MLYNFSYFMIMFVIYSVIGYFMEVTTISIKKDKLVFSRGYLIGPYLPIFGFGAITIIDYLEKYQDDIVALFILGLVTCCILEYFTSLLMEKIFHLRWWDYSDKKFHINGRVCLENGIYFGIGAILLIKYINPWITKQVLSLSSTAITVIGIILFIILLIDFILSTYIILQLKQDIKTYHEKDSTEIVRSKMKKILSNHTIFQTRILDAYPRMRESHNLKRIKEIIEINKKK